MNEGNNQRNPRRSSEHLERRWDVQEVSEPTRRTAPQQRRPAAGGQQQRRPAAGGQQQRRPAAGSQQQRRTAPTSGTQRSAAPARRPAAPQQRTARPAGTASQQRRPAKKKRNYTRIYLFLIALVLIVLLFFGIKLLKGKDKPEKGTSSAADTTEITTTTEPVVTEPPIVQEITFNTDSLYSVAAGAEIVHHNGDRKMKVQAAQGDEPAQIVWNLPQLVGQANVPQIRTLSMDITCSASGAIGQCSSGLRALVPQVNAETGAQEGEKPLKISDILLLEDTLSENTWHVEISIPQNVLTGNVTQLAFVRYADSTPTDLYLDNIRFLDAYGNPMDVIYNNPGANSGAFTNAPTESTTTTSATAVQ